MIKYETILINSRQKQLTSRHARQREKCRIISSIFYFYGFGQNKRDKRKHITELISAVRLAGLIRFLVAGMAVDVCNSKKYCSHQPNDLWKLCHVKQSNKVQTISLQTRLGKIFTRQYIIFIVTTEIAHSQLGEQIAVTFLARIFSKN